MSNPYEGATPTRPFPTGLHKRYSFNIFVSHVKFNCWILIGSFSRAVYEAVSWDSTGACNCRGNSLLNAWVMTF
jgi:hypothetical protein